MVENIQSDVLPSSTRKFPPSLRQTKNNNFDFIRVKRLWGMHRTNRITCLNFFWEGLVTF